MVQDLSWLTHLSGMQRKPQPERARALQRGQPGRPLAGGRVTGEVDAHHAQRAQRRCQLYGLHRRGGVLAPVDAQQQLHHGLRSACR